MAGMGPPPKPGDQRRRTNPTIALTRLPAEGRTGPAPGWPLIPDVVLTTRHELAVAKVRSLEYDLEEAAAEDRPTAAIERRLDTAREKAAIMAAQLREQRQLEATLWADLWLLPQAVQWERLGWTRDVAQYVRHKVMAELGDMDGAREARQWSDRLGLSPMALLRLRWEIVSDEVTARRETKAAAPAKSARTRLKVVDPGVAGA
jgi:hypothetical protein